MNNILDLIVTVVLTIVTVRVVITYASNMNNKQLYKKLDTINFDDLDVLIENKETFIAYFGWTKRCPDSIQVQKNYIDRNIDKEPIISMKVLDLDVLLPRALTEKELREEMTNKYGVYYGPTFIKYVNGEVVDILEHNEETRSIGTAINKELLDKFFSTE